MELGELVQVLTGNGYGRDYDSLRRQKLASSLP